MASPPTTIPALPPAPDLNDRSTFNARAYAWSVALGPYATGLQLVGENAYSNAAEAYASAQTASAQAQAAVAAVNSPKWVTGTNYTAGDTAWSLLNGRTYRARNNLSPSTVDPALAPTDWWDIASVSGRPMVTYPAGGPAIAGFHHVLTGSGDLVLPTTGLVDGSTVVEFLDLSESLTAALDPGPNKIRNALGKCTLNVKNARAVLVWTASKGWV
ncbi:hypothetical protein [Hydrogenophaga atypica]|uniref:Chitin-binding type-3 domain-containing protein n=1 Tax=Hydrogenophaga atypica TaxID=249409 RepID=A0ABW2QI28_9BURK